MTLPLGIPPPQEIQEEPIRPLLAVLDQTASAVLATLNAQNPDGKSLPYSGANQPADAAEWMDTALAIQIEGLLLTLKFHALALEERHRPRPYGNKDF